MYDRYFVKYNPNETIVVNYDRSVAGAMPFPSHYIFLFSFALFSSFEDFLTTLSL